MLVGFGRALAVIYVSNRLCLLFSQVSRFDLEQQKEREKRQAAAKVQESAKARQLDESDYAKMVVGHNENCADGIDARNVDEALAQLSVSECVGLQQSQCQPVPN